MADQPAYPTPQPGWYWFWVRTFRMGLRILTKRVHIEGQQHIPEHGAVILVINHLSHLDTPVISVVCPRLMYPIVADKYKRHPFAMILRAAGTIWINREAADKRAIKQSLAVLNDDHVLTVAIEGTRSRSKTLAEGKGGVAFLATRTGATIVPVAMWGTEQILPALRRLRRAEVHVRIGEPFRLPGGRARGEELDTYTQEVMRRLATLLPEDYRGAYADTGTGQPETRETSTTAEAEPA